MWVSSIEKVSCAKTLNLIMMRQNKAENNNLWSHDKAEARTNSELTSTHLGAKTALTGQRTVFIIK